jgi:2-amino-4-hydroxy-6-hydroxymethyldihydropteridine diphosphokinase
MAMTSPPRGHHGADTMHATMKTTTNISPNESPNIGAEGSRGPSDGPILDAVVGFGGNVGDRLEYFRAAAAGLTADSRVFRAVASAVYETRAIGPSQPDYLNAAVRLSFFGLPQELLELCLDVERGLGRVRRERWGPRVIDLDVLWIAGVCVEVETLIVPHPRLLERRFALGPLADVAPEATDPRTGVRFRDVLGRSPDDEVRHFRKSDWLPKSGL